VVQVPNLHHRHRSKKMEKERAGAFLLHFGFGM
jgi:hypothetical protein